MSFGRKIANRIVLAYLIPLAFTLALGILIIHLRGDQIRLRDYAAGMALVLIPAVLLGRLITRPIALHLGQLRHGAERIQRGDYHARISAGSRDEFADVARAFNHMADVLAQRESALREQNGALGALNRRFEAVLNAANDGIAMLDGDGHFVLINRRFGELLGSHPDALLHRAAEEAPPLLLERLVRLSSRLPAADAGAHGVAEEMLEMGGPDARVLQFFTAPVMGEGGLGEDGRGAIGRIIVLRDVTRERELDKLKTDFISVVSHELRTPLTSIRGYTDLMLSGATGEPNELQAEFLGIIQASTARLSNLINDILDISRIESGSISLRREAVDYRAVVSDTLRLVKAAADEKQVSIDASLPEAIPPVRGDADKVAQVLTNLVGNAVKYTPEGGWVKVSVEATPEGVTTTVADGGIGIAPEDQKRLFQKFFRADNTSTREAGGTGLGLVIAKTIIELLGGTIWVESEPGRGSRFHFTLPLFRPSGGPADAPAAALPERGLGLALIVDDDAYVRGLIRHALHRRGYGTLEAADGLEAHQKARLHRPDAVVLDMVMPDMDGLRALRALKSDPATAPIPVLAVSILGDPSRGEMAVGAFSFLCKPVSASAVATAVRAATQGRAGASALAVCGQGSALCAALDEAASVLNGEGVTLGQAETAPEAVARVITEAPAIVLLDTALPDAELFELILALKAEEEAARIPLVLLTGDIPQDGLHFHIGTEAVDNAALLDYLCEQVACIMPPTARQVNEA